MPKFPEPPSLEELAGLPPDVQLLSRGTELWRLYFRGGRHPAHWDEFRSYGPVATARFDHHLPPPHAQARSILYAARHGPACIAEVFQNTRVVDRHRREPWLVGFALTDDIALLDLTGPWPTAAGASMALSTGPRTRAQRWSRIIYEAYPQLQGLWYPSSMHGNTPAVALFDRAQDALPHAPFFHRPLTDPALLPALRTIAAELGYALV